MVDGMLWRTAGKSARYAGELVVPEPLDVVRRHLPFYDSQWQFSATDCYLCVDVVDTIEQLLMVRIVECRCQIVRDEYCSVSRIFLKPAAMSAVIVDRAVHVECFDQKSC